ncbi:MAG TPA: T9SS type A sorting domain-containing protein [Bacteroidales bacterium]|nr:T9SS type A sorting domain-containing protein [Bacteroidales bacterium]
MKKPLFFLCAFFMICLQLNAQIVLTQANTDFTPGAFSAVGADLTGFNLPVAGLNQQWNYSTLTATGVYNMNYITPTDINFPAATYADTNLSNVFIPGKYYYSDGYYQTNAIGANCLGFVINEQKYGSISANPSDSCIFPQQFCAFTSPSYLMPFPTTMSSSWHAHTRGVANFQLTVSAYGLNQTPCQKVTHTYKSDTVVAWGKMRVPAGAGASLAYDVLLVKRMTVQVDSFYMSGTPAPAVLLTAFGVSQGQSTTSNRYLFWRENAKYPLMMINFGSNNFTTPTGVFYDGAAQYDPNGISENSNTDFNIYPNPGDGNFTIQFDQVINEAFNMKIYDLVGKVVYSQQINPTGNSQQVSVENLISGTYFIRIDADDVHYSSKLVIQ